MNIGVAGRVDITAEEAEDLNLLGILIAEVGHSLTTTTAPGTNAAVKSGFESGGVAAHIVPNKVFSNVDFGIAYIDTNILDQLRTSGAPLQDITVLLTHDELRKYLDKAVMLARPPHS